MDKLYFKKNTLIRTEHFGMLILTLDGIRFSVPSRFEPLLAAIGWSTVDAMVRDFSGSLDGGEIIEFIESLLKKWILILSDTDPKKQARIVKNEFVSNDCLSYPRTVYWELTQKCNLNCIHCYSGSMAGGYEGLWFATIRKTIDEMVEKGVEFLNIGGGEPMMYRDIYATLKYAISQGLMIEMTTNGTLINNLSILKLKQSWLRFIQISLDGSNKETYESVRIGSDFDRVIKSIRALIRAGFTVSVNTVLMRKNQYDILAIVKLCESLGVNYYKVSPLMETGRASEEQPSKQLSLAEYREIYQNVLEYKNARKPGGMQVIFYQNTVRPEVKNISWMPEEHFGCPAWRTTCGIDSRGNVYPCSYMNHPELSCGNIADTPLSQIWKKSQMMAKIRDVKQLFGKCAKCRHLSLCRGGCRAMAYLRYQKIDASDPLCVVEP